MSDKHRPVLLHEVYNLLDTKEGETLLDGTLGSGGHSAFIAEKMRDKVLIVGLDRDSDAVKRSTEKLQSLGARFHARTASFRDLGRVLDELGVQVDAILLDLGISSDQLDASGRGFSFLKDEPLLMTMKEDVEEGDLTAKEILNTFTEEALELILRGFGEERYSRKIARQIVESRVAKPFETTFDLVEAVKLATPSVYHHGKIHPATRTFQSLRIAVNEELDALEDGLEEGWQRLKTGGRFAVISFHSLEDRIVKNFFRDKVQSKEAESLTRKPVTASEEECSANPRSRSAKLRAIKKI